MRPTPFQQGAVRNQAAAASELRWSPAWQLSSAAFTLTRARGIQTLELHTDGRGRWHDGDGSALPALDGCIDIDIWPSPFTNTFPIRRQPLAIGERRLFRMAWVFGPTLAVQAQEQAYTRVQQRRYLFEGLDDEGFEAELEVDADGVVLDYPGLFRRVAAAGDAAAGATS